MTVVAVLNFRFGHSENWPSDRYHSSYRLREDVSGEVMTEVLRFVFLELGRFRKRIWELESVFDKWMYLLKHMHELESIPEKFSDPLFRRLFMLSEIANFTPMELEQYENSLKDMSDYYNIIRTAEEDAEQRGLAKGLAQGREEGREEGRKEGREEGKAKAIATMLASGISVETIASAFGMTVEECLSCKN